MNVTEVEKDEKDHEDYLNECFGEVDICGLKYAAGYALREIDPIAFQCGLSDMPLQYQCGECEKVFEEDEEDEAEECCQSHCEWCGKLIGDTDKQFCSEECKKESD